MRSHKPGISSLPSSQGSRMSLSALFVLQTSHQVSSLAKGQSFLCMCRYLPEFTPATSACKSPKSNRIFTQHCRSLYTTPNPWVCVLRGIQALTAGQQHWDDGLGGFLESNQLLGRKLGIKPWIRPRLEMLRKHFWLGWRSAEEMWSGSWQE